MASNMAVSLGRNLFCRFLGANRYLLPPLEYLLVNVKFSTCVIFFFVYFETENNWLGRLVPTIPLVGFVKCRSLFLYIADLF